MLSQLIMTVKGLAVIMAAIYGLAWLLRKEDAEWVRSAPRILLPAIFLIGMWGHIVWVPYLALMMSIPLLAKDRGDAAALYAIAILALPGLSYKILFGSFYLMTLTKYVFCALGLGIAFLMKRGSGGGAIGRRFDIPFLLMFVLEASQARDPSYTETLRELTPIVLTLVLPYFLVSRSLTSRQDVHRFLLAVAAGGFVMAVVATLETQFHWLIYKTIESNLNLSTQINAYGKMRGGVIRAPASFPESTSLGNYLALASVAILALRDSFGSRTKWYAAIGVMTLGLLAANSRGGLIGIALGMLAFDLYCGRSKALFTKLAVVGGAYGLLLGLAPFSPYAASLIGKDAGTASSSDYRVLLLRRGMEEIGKHPVLGVNLKQALTNLEDIRQGEHIIDLVNGYVSYGLTLGYMGMAGLLAVFVSLAAAMLLARRKLAANEPMIEAAGFTFAVAVFTIASGFYTGFGGPSSTPFLEVAAFGAALWALRGHATGTSAAHETLAPALRSGLAARILRDRAEALAQGGSPAALAYRARSRDHAR